LILEIHYQLIYKKLAMLMEQLLANENPELYNHHYQSLNEFTI